MTTAPIDIDAIRNRLAAATPGPWEWGGSGETGVKLWTVHSGKRHVMGFQSKGLQGAQPCFLGRMGMAPADDLLRFQVGNPDVVGMTAAKADLSVYRFHIRGIAHPDAELIAHAPTDIAALLAEVDRLRALLAEKETPDGR